MAGHYTWSYRSVSISSDEIDLVVREGGKKWAAHLARERNRKIIEAKKASVLRTTGRLSCEVCSFDFSVYGPIGRAFCEVHHGMSLSADDHERETRLEDLHVLCANCHRMIHRCEDPSDIAGLRQKLHGRAPN